MLIQSYLTNRHQKVISNNVSSTWKKVQCGVAQGSILGPLLFLIYVNDLPSIISKNNHTLLLYTDDTSLVITESSSTALKQQATSLLNDINSWFKSNLLLLNLNKTQYLEFSTKNSATNELIHDRNNLLHTVTYIKFLGLTIDYILSWHLHIE